MATVLLRPIPIVAANQRIDFKQLSNPQIQQLLTKRLYNDYTNVRSILYDPYQVIGYKYNPKLNLIALDDFKVIDQDYISMCTIGPDTGGILLY